MKKKLFFVLLLAFGFVNAQLAIIGNDKKFGFMDTNGKIVIPIQYKAVGGFSDGLAAVELKGKWGYIDSSGKMVIEPKFDHVKRFDSGIAVVELKKRWYYIDKSGNEITGFPETDKVFDFENGIAFFRQKNLVGFFNMSGEIILTPTYKKIISFKLDWAKFTENDKWGLLDKNGKIYIPAEYDDIDISDNKIIIARKGIDWGVIGFDKSFKKVEGATKIWEFLGENGMLTYAKKNEKIGFIDTNGSWVIEPKYDKAKAFNQGLAPVAIDKKWGFIDAQGNTVIYPKFGYAEIFSDDGLAPVIFDKLWGFIDTSGNKVIPDLYEINEKYDFIFVGGDNKAFINGLARVKLKKQWGFINTSGQLVGEWFDFAEIFTQ